MNSRGNRLLSCWRHTRNRCGWSCCSELSLEFADGALQPRKLFRVFFGEAVQLLAEFCLLDIETDGQKGSGEQQQRIQNANEDQKGHGCSSDAPLDYF